MKTCSKCGVAKSQEAFSPDKRSADGRCTYCKACKAALEQARRERLGDKVNEQPRARRRAEPERYVLKDMIRRCTDPRRDDYKFYGARGVSVAAEWTGPGGFERFFAHVGPRPSAEHTIDRKDTTGNYEPGNVRWITLSEQQRNRRDNRPLTVGGETMLLADWAIRHGVEPRLITQRIDMLGWSVRDAVLTPTGGKRRAA